MVVHRGCVGCSRLQLKNDAMTAGFKSITVHISVHASALSACTSHMQVTCYQCRFLVLSRTYEMPSSRMPAHALNL